MRGLVNGLGTSNFEYSQIGFLIMLLAGGLRTPNRSPAMPRSPADSRGAGSVPPQGGAFAHHSKVEV
jgi:hypothetical protein